MGEHRKDFILMGFVGRGEFSGCLDYCFLGGVVDCFSLRFFRMCGFGFEGELFGVAKQEILNKTKGKRLPN